MNLKTKKQLAAKTLEVGKNRLVFNQESLSDIKEAITKQDIKTLYDEGIISIKPVKGRKRIEKRKTKRGPGKIKFKINKRKQEYVKLTRKLRKYLKELKIRGEVDRELYYNLRTKIKMRDFKSRAQFKEYLSSLEKNKIKEKKQVKQPEPKEKELKSKSKKGAKK
ncbi:MAG: 50S ribosomal protein L19e [Candidatus Nanoarchaeia archaeon]|nr:50S ribosomal protein L19e [Candidatus Nanoarchaeia archaeon]